MATSQPTAVLTATSQRLCGPAPVPPPRRPPVLDRRQVAVPWPGVELRRALGNPAADQQLAGVNPAGPL